MSGEKNETYLHSGIHHNKTRAQGSSEQKGAIGMIVMSHNPISSVVDIFPEKRLDFYTLIYLHIQMLVISVLLLLLCRYRAFETALGGGGGGVRT